MPVYKIQASLVFFSWGQENEQFHRAASVRRHPVDRRRWMIFGGTFATFIISALIVGSSLPPVTEALASTYDKNCDAVRAAGAAPIRIGQPGYSKKLDRDGEGIGCE